MEASRATASPIGASDAVIDVAGLTKRFDSVVAVDDVSFMIRRGQITALLGGNGAGKTTTISMLLGLLIPTSGAITVLGEDMLHRRYRVLPRLNFSSPYVDLPHRLTVRQNLMVFAHLYSLHRPGERIRGRGHQNFTSASLREPRALLLAE